MHKIEVPSELQTVDELIIPTSYPAKRPDDPAFALYVVYPNAGLVEVLPQKWFTASQYQVGKQWIHACGARSRIASHFWRVFWQRQFPAGGRRMPPGAMAGEERVGSRCALASCFLNLRSRILNLELPSVASLRQTAVCALPLGCYTVTFSSSLMNERIDPGTPSSSTVLESHIDPTSARFEANMRFLADLVSQVRNEEERIREGGGPKAIESQHNKGRLTARERINLLVDPGTFFELGAYAAHGMYEEWGGAAAAGVITGLARIQTRLVMIIANDATVKAGAFFPMTAKKVIRAQNISIENRVPTVYLGSCMTRLRACGTPCCWASSFLPPCLCFFCGIGAHHWSRA